MAAEPGNRYWELRDKSGREKIFNTPADLWAACCAYFEWAKEHPWYKKEAIKSGELAGEIIDIPTERPFTISALCIHLNISRKTWELYKKRKDFIPITDTVDEIIWSQLFEGATVGAFNANLVARKLSLADKSEVTGADGTPLVPTPPSLNITVTTPGAKISQSEDEV